MGKFVDADDNEIKNLLNQNDGEHRFESFEMVLNHHQLYVTGEVVGMGRTNEQRRGGMNLELDSGN